MVFYFSGTGNAEWAARQIGEYFGEPVCAMASEILHAQEENGQDIVYTLNEGERLFLVFTVHSWGPAVIAKIFAERLLLKNYHGQEVTALCVCGDNCGNTDKILRRILMRRGIRLNAVFSLVMPNNYILMKGFGLDSPEVEREKLDSARERLQAVIEAVETKRYDAPLYIRGKCAGLKSSLVYPAFVKYAIRKVGFYATEKCISCGECMRVCPTENIVMEDGHPRWGNNCVQCTACIHHCPVRAIEFGNITQNQGRYLHPEHRK